MLHEFEITKMNGSEDWDSVRRIYEEGIATRNATFETAAPDWDKWNCNHLSECRLLAKAEDRVLGWAALSPISSRQVYAGVAEVSIYFSADARGLGVGKVLLQELVRYSESNGIWTLQAGIFPENVASIELHKKYEFREVGTRERIGQLGSLWRDVVLLERRSNVAGI